MPSAIISRQTRYACRLADSPADVEAAQHLRFEVFNLELQEGLVDSFVTGLDRDRFDPFCDHLLVFDEKTNAMVGTYRMQPGNAAAQALGYYSADEFDLAPFENVRGQVIELGRACIHREHRTATVLDLLWRGLVRYAKNHRARYLIGCSSLTSQDEALGVGVYGLLRERHLACPEFRTLPLPHCRCANDGVPPPILKVPKLLRTYLEVGAKICGPPAIDRMFGTIDFLTFMDLQGVPAVVRRRYGV